MSCRWKVIFVIEEFKIFCEKFEKLADRVVSTCSLVFVSWARLSWEKQKKFSENYSLEKQKKKKLDSSSSGNIFKKLDLLILWTCHEFYSKKIKLKSCSFFKLQKCHCLTKNHPKQVRRQMERRLSVKTTATNHINCNSSKLSQRQSRIPHRRRQV